MKTTLALYLAALALVRGAEAPNEPEPIQWVFLNTGSQRAKAQALSQEELDKMQAAHVGNFGALFDQGRLFAAGPLGDNGRIRGSVVLTAATEAEARECFRADPFIQSGRLDAEIHPWRVDIMKFCSPKVPFQMAQHTLCIVKQGPRWLSANRDLSLLAMVHLFPSLKPKAQSGELAISGPILDGGEKVGLMLFYSTNQAEIQAALDQEAAVRAGRVKLELHPQFIAAGTFRAPKTNLGPPEPGEPERLFDGQHFVGWEGDTRTTWRIRSGALVGGSTSEPVRHNEFLCTTREFKNFDLRLRVKLVGTGFVNGGVQFRSRRCQNPAYEMTGYQADMGQGYWGSLYDESRRNKTLAHTHAAVIARIVKTNDWNDYIIRCEDRRIRLWLNGTLTVDYTETDATVPLSGLIGLQIHGGGKAEASYRDIRLQELP